MFYLILMMIVCANATTMTENFMKKNYAISKPYYLQNLPVYINSQKTIPKDELLPPYEIPKWVYKRVFKKNKPNKYNS